MREDVLPVKVGKTDNDNKWMTWVIRLFSQREVGTTKGGSYDNNNSVTRCCFEEFVHQLFFAEQELSIG